MDRSEVFNKVQDVCRDVFEDETLVISESTTATDVEGWDSLSYLTLVDELEKIFGVAFTLDELMGSANIGELVNVLMDRINKK